MPAASPGSPLVDFVPTTNRAPNLACWAGQKGMAVSCWLQVATTGEEGDGESARRASSPTTVPAMARYCPPFFNFLRRPSKAAAQLSRAAMQCNVLAD